MNIQEQPTEAKLPKFETRAVYTHDDFKTKSLTYGIVFRTHRERLEFIELARKGVGL